MCRPAEIEGAEIPAGARVMVSYASANRDECHCDAPDVFEITRNSAGHVAFGFGDLACARMELVRLEGAAVPGGPGCAGGAGRARRLFAS
jgi:cytochrome P450